MSEEYDHGYRNPYKINGGSSYEAQEGAQDALNRQQPKSPKPVSIPSGDDVIISNPWPKGNGVDFGDNSSAPATLKSMVEGCALLGAFGGAGYVFFTQNGVGWSEALAGGIAGAIVGGVTGVPLYGVILVLRPVFKIIAWVLRMAIITGIVICGLYLIGQFLGTR